MPRERDPSKSLHSICMPSLKNNSPERVFHKSGHVKTLDREYQKCHPLDAVRACTPHLRSRQGTFPALGPTCRVASTHGGPSGGGLLWPSPARFVTPAELSPENPSRSQPPAPGGSDLSGFLPPPSRPRASSHSSGSLAASRPCPRRWRLRPCTPTACSPRRRSPRKVRQPLGSAKFSAGMWRKAGAGADGSN